jgi:hypothetical protein
VSEDLDWLLRVDAGLEMTGLAWLTTPRVDATAAAVKTSMEKLVYLRGMDAHRLDLSMLPADGYYLKSHYLPPLTDGVIDVLAEHAWQKSSGASYILRRSDQ